MNIQQVMKQAQQMQSKIAELQAKLEAEETEGSSGGGMVVVVLNGKSQMLRIKIDPSLLDPSEVEVLEDLIIAAYNDAKDKVESNFTQQMEKIAGSMGLPPGFKMPF